MWRYVLLSFCLFALNSCKPIHIDYDSQTNFSQYKTYNFYGNIHSGLNELNDSRMRRAVDNAMRQKGLLKSNNPDVLINYYTRSSKKPSYSSVGLNIGGRVSRHVGLGVNTHIPVENNRQIQHITFDIIDKNRDRLIWQAEMRADVKEGGSVASRDAQYTRNVSKLLRNFPPNRR